MKTISLTQNKTAFFDDCDFPLISAYKWFAHRIGNKYYAETKIQKKNVYMHKLILDAPNGFVTDHIDGNGLNNSRANLRLVSYQQNAINRNKRQGTSSLFKGVDFHCESGKWRSRIKINGNEQIIGYFNSEIMAALEYDVQAAKVFGEYARQG
jgi:hypothetical protein